MLIKGDKPCLNCTEQQLVHPAGGLEFARKHNVELEEKDISTDEQSVKEVLEIGGKRQVPFLVDESANISMYESEEIIDYLKQKYVKENSPLG